MDFDPVQRNVAAPPVLAERRAARTPKGETGAAQKSHAVVRQVTTASVWDVHATVRASGRFVPLVTT